MSGEDKKALLLQNSKEKGRGGRGTLPSTSRGGEKIRRAHVLGKEKGNTCPYLKGESGRKRPPI